MKRILIILLSILSVTAISQRSDNLKPFNWEVISGVDKILQYDNEENMSKNARKKFTAGNTLYLAGITEMKNKRYKKAIENFSEALKNYKRARISSHAYNYIYINMALSYANTGNEKDKSVASRFISLVTSKIEKEKEWLYHLAIAKNLVGDYNNASDNLSKVIRLDQNYFQAYITLEAIYRNNNNKNSADKVRDRMETAEAILIKKTQKKERKEDNKSLEDKSNNTTLIIKGKEPNIKELNIIKDDDNLQYNKMSEIKERSMKSVQEGIGDYNSGVEELSKVNLEL